MLCPGCRRVELTPFLRMEAVPVHCNVLSATREEALHVPRGDIQLSLCDGCGLIYNTKFDAALMTYTQRYENSLHFSLRFQSYALGLAARLVEQYGLYGKHIVEVGCGRGDFLRMICEGGNNHGVGFDPGYEGEEEDVPGSGTIHIKRELYGGSQSEALDLLVCRHTLEHVEDPREFLLRIREIGREGAVYFEVPNAAHMLENMRIWDVIYEHCSYFTETSLMELFRSVGFSVQRIYTDFGSQYLCLEGHLRGPVLSFRKSSIGGVAAMAAEFGRQSRQQLRAWDQQISSWLGEGKKVVAWGGGSKGTTFLNAVESACAIEYIVDVNPRKQGKYVAGSGQRFVTPEFLIGYQPDVVIIMNVIYKEEIEALLERLQISGELVVA